MRTKPKKDKESYYDRLEREHLWFAWRPVQIQMKSGKSWVWWEWVHRQCMYSVGLPGDGGGGGYYCKYWIPSADLDYQVYREDELERFRFGATPAGFLGIVMLGGFIIVMIVAALLGL